MMMCLMESKFGRWWKAAAFLCLLAIPRGVIAQANPATPDLVQVLSQQSYMDSLNGPTAAAPAAAAPLAPAVGKPASTYRCLPSCDAQDGRFLAVAGANLVTLSGREMSLAIGVPAGSTTFSLGVFDGDVRAADGSGVLHWDIGTATLYEYTLYADPFGDGTGLTVVDMVPGTPVLASTSMPDNAWIDFTIATTPAAQAPSGNFFYRLNIKIVNPTITALNAFKIRATGVVSGVALDPVNEPFSYIASFTSVGDAQTVFPNYPTNQTGARYDGVFDFYFDLPVSRSEVAVWDGDFDRGKFDGTLSDTDDPDTPGAPFLPSWSTIDTLPEGIATGVAPSTGNPPDDRNPTGTNGPFLLKTPAVRYDLIFPDGQTFPDENPSGNQEWEQFKVTTNAADPLADGLATAIPAGKYRVRVQGVDMQNLNALLLPGRILCVLEDGTPCTPLRPFLVGDLVITDCLDEVSDEPPLPGVVLELIDPLGAVIATVTTDADGLYNFPVEAGSYTVHVADSNFDPGGALEGYAPRSPLSLTADVIDDNVLTFDFGFCPAQGSIGDLVWQDDDGNGVRDGAEAGIPDVFLELLDGDGLVIDSTLTDFDGFYTFSNVPAGNYTVRIDPLSIPPGLNPLSDLDGVSTPHQSAVALTAGQTRTDVDFGYGTGGNASIGDRIWYDADGDGVQDPGEIGLPGVTVRLLDGATVVDTVVTGADGIYTFSGLSAGSFSVVVDATTLPAGLAPTFDLDGIASAHTAAVTIAAGDTRTDVDFGYRGTASLGDRIWYDGDGDGVQDPGEAGLTGVSVELLDGGGTVIGTTTTGADGLYSFAHLAAGTYTVRVVAATLPVGSAATYDLDGIATAHTAAALLTAGQARTDVDFGYRGTASLGDRVWYDGDGDGVQDPGEAGLAGVTVELLNAGGTVVDTTTTAADGLYTFAHLAAGSYTVRVVSATLPAGSAPTFDLDGIATAHTAVASLTGGQARTDVDFGYRGTASLGDRLWTDSDGDGIQDVGETGLVGVTVELLDNGGTVIGTTTTAADGLYTFAHLAAGDYTVRVVAATLPAGLAPVFDLDGIATAHTAAATLTGGQTRDDVDFGYQGTGSLGDRVWYDADGDGVQDPGENGLVGVTVELLDNGGNVLTSTTTAADGLYTFNHLAAGTFTVRVVAATLPAGIAPTFDLDGIATVNTAAATLTGGQTRTDVDFGYRGTASLGDRIWLDFNGDGNQDPGETGLVGVTVELLDNGGTVLATTTTAADGIYGFSHLVSGTYTVRVVAATLPAGVAPTYDLDGIATASTAAVTLTDGQTRTDVDYGYRGTASIGDRVWLDGDGDGVQDPGESGLTGVKVELLNSGGTVIDSMFTGSDGIYTFANLTGGTYTVRVAAASLPVGVTPSFDLDGIASAHTAAVTLTDGEPRSDVDFGYRGTASLGDRLWIDSDGDGIQDGGEIGLTGVTVELLDDGGLVIDTTTTGANGLYTFNFLAAGTYTVRVVSTTLPAGLAPSFDLDGIATAHTAGATLTGGQNRTDVDFGYRGTASLGDRLWLDADGDGAQDAGEEGLVGVSVEILDGGGAVLGTTTTGADGLYTFEHLTAGTYTVRVVSATLPAGLAATFDLDGIATLHTAAVTLAGGDSRTDVDFGYRGTASLGDRIWSDLDADGVQDGGENGLTGVTVELLNGGGTVIDSTVTGVDGLYTFNHLAAGTYTVRVVSATLPAGSAPSFDLDGIGSAHTAAATLAGGQNRTDVDFGYRGTASLGDRLWVDGDGDGVQDGGENGLSGVTVELLDGSGNLLTSTTTGANGLYTFNQLPGGVYIVRVDATTLPAGLTPTYDLDGIGSQNAAELTLDGGANRDDVDFGYRGTGSIGDRLWYDGNGDGSQDPGEDGLVGVTVELLNGAGTVIATTVTGADGLYTFENLPAGTFTVRVAVATLPAGLAATYDLDGIGSAHTASVSLTGGQTRTDVDFGYRGSASIGDRLWNDVDADGFQDGGEAGLVGVTVELLDSLDNVIGSTVTGANGLYGFGNLGAGTYTVRVVTSTLPGGYVPTYDLDGAGTAHFATVALAGGQNRTDVDFGYRSPVGTFALGDRVWNDANGDGVQDSGEAGINGLTVQLLDGGGLVIATTATAGDGDYLFLNLLPGNYSVRVDSATLPVNVAPTYDLDGIGTAHIATVALTASRSDLDFGYRGSAAVKPILECVVNNGDSTWTAFFGYLNENVLPVSIPVGSTNGFSPTPDDRGQPTTFQPGRTPFWPDASFSVVFDGSNLVWSLAGRTSTANSGSTPCSNHVFFEKKWHDAAGNVTTAPPANLPANYQLTATSPLGTATCTYPVGATALTCTYANNQPPALDNNGLWVPVGSTYTVTETGLPPGGSILSGTGPVTLPSALCEPGRNGLQKHCTHTVHNQIGGQSCVIPAEADASWGGAGGGHTFWMPGIGTDFIFTPLPGGFSTNGDGTARLIGTVKRQSDLTQSFLVDVQFSGFSATAPPDSPKKELAASAYVENGGPVDPSSWLYYTSYTGTLTGTGSYAGAVITITRTGPSFQVGVGASGKNTNYGASGWFLWTVTQQPTAGDPLQAEGQGDINVDLTECPIATASIGDRVWVDVDGDGLQDPGENGLAGVIVDLLDDGGSVLATATTDADGLYTFANLTAGSYSVRVDVSTLPAGVSPSYDLDGTATAHVAAVTLTAGQIRTDVDFGYGGTASIGDQVWFDADLDGVQDAGEPGIAGVILELLDGSSNVIATATTDANGLYTFDHLVNGTYTVRVVTSSLPANVAPSFDQDGVATPHLTVVSLTAGTVRTDIDFGYRPTVGTLVIGDRVWNDADGDDVQDAGEVGLDGVTVQLLDEGGIVVATTATAGGGAYSFTALLPGVYTVRIDTASLPANFGPTYDLDGAETTPHNATVTLTETRSDVDFGYRGPAGTENCASKADADPTVGGANGGHALWLPGIGTDFVFTPAPGGFVTNSDGTAFLTGTVRRASNPNQGFLVDIALTGFSAVVPPGSPKQELAASAYKVNGGPVDPSTWIYFTSFSGTLTGTGDYAGAVLNIVNTGPAFQVGIGANSKNLNYGGSGWFLWTVAQQPVAGGSLQAEGQGDVNIDLGTCPPATASIGDRLWLDVDGDGVQDAGEEGLTGVGVELLSSTGALLLTTVTGADGIYTFGSLPAGVYTVRVVTSTLPAGLAATFDLDGAGTAHTTAVSLTSGQVRTDVDFGYRGTGTIGDLVWLDEDGDGFNEPGEAGMPGITVELLDNGGNVLATTTTGANGNYLFSNLSVGTYAVRIVITSLPAGANPTYDLDGITTAHVAGVTVANDQDRTDVDFGYRITGTGSIGDRVWFDVDGDGVQDATEPGINNVTVQLLNSAGTVIATTTTAGNGTYTFSNLAAGNYSVKIVSSTLPAGAVPTFDLNGVATAHITAVTLTAGQNRTDVDFGYKGTVCLGDLVWKDLDGDGVQDYNESGIGGVTVQLYDAANNLIATRTTSSTANCNSGNYSFCNLLPGTYTVRVVASTLPSNYIPAYDLDGVVTPHAATVTVLSGTNNNVDFGYRCNTNGSIGDRVWLDRDGDKVQDSGEPGLNGVTVELLNSSGTVIATTTTAGNGNYTFENVPTGSYSVRIVTSTLPAGAVPTHDLNGTATPHVTTVSVGSSQNRTDVDFGYKGAINIGDKVWQDKDNDGVQDSGEPGIGYVTVQLYDAAGNLVATTTTDCNGNYLFTNLLAGTYTVKIVASTLPSNFVPTYDLDGVASAHQATFTATATRTDVDFGYRCLAVGSIGDRVWLDSDGDGVQDSGEAGINGVTVQLLDNQGTVLATATTSGNGNYTFPNLSPATYTVKIVSSTLPAGAMPTYDRDGTGSAHSAAVSVSANQNRTDVDFGYKGSLSIGDKVWNDKDGDGVQDSGEPGLDDVTVQLYDAAGTLVATTTTDCNGNYTFTNRLAGTYTVKIVASTLPSGYTPTFDRDGVATAHAATFTLTASRTDIDFGYKSTAAPGTGTQGYWKNHPEAWPVQSIVIGGRTYSKSQAINWMNTSSSGDKSIDMFKQLVSAKLNVLVGNNATCINSTISSADAWMVANPVGSGVSGSSSAWSQASAWHTQLDNYNNGLLCAPHRN